MTGNGVDAPVPVFFIVYCEAMISLYCTHFDIVPRSLEYIVLIGIPHFQDISVWKAGIEPSGQILRESFLNALRAKPL